MVAGDAFLQLGRKAFFELHDRGAVYADQMMMMAVFAFANQFEPGPALAEVEALHNAHLLQQMHGTIHRRQVTVFAADALPYFLDREWMRMVLEHSQNGFSLVGQLARLAAQSFG